jgi:hypothetical protein
VNVVERDVEAGVDGRELRGFNQRATTEAMLASVERRVCVAAVKLSVASVPAHS